MPKLVMVETLSQFLHRYVVELPDDAPNFKATDMVLFKPDMKEMSQTHLGEMDLSTRTITREDYLTIFNEDNDYLLEWEDDKKFEIINKFEENK